MPKLSFVHAQCFVWISLLQLDIERDSLSNIKEILPLQPTLPTHTTQRFFNSIYRKEILHQQKHRDNTQLIMVGHNEYNIFLALADLDDHEPDIQPVQRTAEPTLNFHTATSEEEFQDFTTVEKEKRKPAQKPKLPTVRKASKQPSPVFDAADETFLASEPASAPAHAAELDEELGDEFSSEHFALTTPQHKSRGKSRNMKGFLRCLNSTKGGKSSMGRNGNRGESRADGK